MQKRFNPPFFLKMSCTKSLIWHVLSHIYFLCVLAFVFVALRHFPLKVDLFPSVLVCNRDLFSLVRFMTFEHQNTTVAFTLPEKWTFISLWCLDEKWKKVQELVCSHSLDIYICKCMTIFFLVSLLWFLVLFKQC